MIVSWFEELADNWSIPAALYSLDGEAIFFNHALIKLAGFCEEPCDNQTLPIQEDIFGECHGDFLRSIIDGKSLTKKYRTLRKANGEKLIVKVEYHPFIDEKKNHVGTLLMISNIVNSLDLSNIYNENIFDVIKVGIISINCDGIITYMNNSVEGLTGIKKEEVLGKPYHGVFPDMEDYINRSFANKTNYIDKRIVVNSGIKERAFILNTSVIKDDFLEVVSINMYLFEITEVNDIYKQLIDHERFRLISEMAAGTAHEIRNPLTSVKGFLQLLDTSLNGSKEKEYINIMLEEIEQISQVIKEFMSLGTQKISKSRKFQLSVLIKDLIKFIKSEALLREVEISLNIISDYTFVYGEKEQIKQVFLNLLQNALHSIGNKGFIHISVSTYDQEIYINVVDSGAGILPQNLSKIFDPFFTTKDNGTGLGLSLSKKIIHDHGGDITVSSKPDQGTAFTVKLPLYNSLCNTLIKTISS